MTQSATEASQILFSPQSFSSIEKKCGENLSEGLKALYTKALEILNSTSQEEKSVLCETIICRISDLNEAALSHEESRRFFSAVKKAGVFNQENFEAEQMLFEAIESKRSDRVQAFVESGLNPNTTCLQMKMDKEWCEDSKHGPIFAINDSLLHIAAENNWLDLARALLDAGAIVNFQNEEKITPIYNACTYNHHQLIDLLLDKGANPFIQNEYGISAFERAMYFGYQNLVERFMHCPGASDYQIKNPAVLQCAIEKELTEYACELIEQGADPHAFLSENHDFTAWLAAAEKGNIKVMKKIITHYPDSLNKQAQKIKTTALHIAVIYKQKECLTFLIKKGADTTIKEQNGLTAKELAAKPEHAEILACFDS